MKARWREEKGAVSFFEGAILFPLLFFVIGVLFFLLLLFWQWIHGEAYLRRQLLQPTSALPLLTELASEEAQASTEGGLIRRAILQARRPSKSFFLRRFSAEPLISQISVRARWADSARMLWDWQFLQGLRKGGAHAPTTP